MVPLLVAALFANFSVCCSAQDNAQSTRIDPDTMQLSQGTKTDADTMQLAQGNRIDAGSMSSSPDSVDGLTNSIFQKEIQFAKMTTTYRLNNSHETRVHKWLTATVSTGAYSTADAGNIITFTNAFRFRNHPQDLHRGTAELGPFLIFLGELMFVGRTMAICTIDGIHNSQIRHEGFDRATFEKNSNILESDIHHMLDQRRQMIASNPDPSLVQEQAVLQDISNSLTREFVRNYARASRIRANHLTENLVNNYTAATGAFVGGLLIYAAARTSNPRLTGPAGIGFIASGCGFILKDFLARRVSQHVEKKTTARLLAEHKATEDPLKSLATDTSGVTSRRKAGYDLMLKALNRDVALSTTENKEEWHKYLHDQTINGLEGLANFAAGSILAEGGFHYQPVVSPLEKLARSRNFLSKFGAAAITFTPTASGGMADTPLEAIYGEYKTHKDCQDGLCPKVGLADRMTMLDQAEATAK